MGLADTLKRAMSAAERSDPTYHFETGDNVVSIPTSLDQRRDTLRALINHQVTIEAEQARLEAEAESTAKQIKRHRVALAKEMLGLGIPSPMANEGQQDD